MENNQHCIIFDITVNFGVITTLSVCFFPDVSSVRLMHILVSYFVKSNIY